ncbi:transcriptional regulator [Bacillus thuringiensis]
MLISRCGNFIEKILNRFLEKEAKLSRPTVSKACNDNDYIPSPTVMKKILKAIRKIKPNAKTHDFWDM